MLVAGLVDTFDAVDARNFADIDKNGFELALVGDFKIGVDAGVGTVGAAFEIVNVGAGAADDGSNFREQSGAVLGANGKLHGEGCGALAAPLDGDAALGLIEQILNVRAQARVHGDAAAAR